MRAIRSPFARRRPSFSRRRSPRAGNGCGPRSRRTTSGLACATRLAHLEDELLRAIHHYVVTFVYPAQNPTAAERLCVAAVGGYGRGTLAPGSDIDLLFLLPYKQTPWGESVVEAMLYVLWDLRQKVGHATRIGRGVPAPGARRHDDPHRAARGALHLRRRGALRRHARALRQGDRAGARRANSSPPSSPNATPASRAPALRAISSSRTSRKARAACATSTRCSGSPNTSIACSDADELVAAGLFTAEEFAAVPPLRGIPLGGALPPAFPHRAGRGAADLRPCSAPIAERLGYVDARRPVRRRALHEALFPRRQGRRRSHRASSARRSRSARPSRAPCSTVSSAACSAAGAPSPARRFRDRDRSHHRRPRRRLRARSGQSHPPVLGRRPLRPRHPSRRDAARHPDRCGGSTPMLRNDPEANRLFLEILTSRNAPETVLRLMNEAGVLGRFIPDFGRIVAMMQFNMYHHYTVDEHLLRAVGILAAIESGRLAEDHPLVDRDPAVDRQPHARSIVALFLHDIAKGRAGGSFDRRRARSRASSARGSASTRPRPRRSPGSSSITSSCRTRRRAAISPTRARSETFAAIVQTLERLRMLLVLTVCDIRAVGPGVWNGWKGQLLRTLYWETEVVLTGGHSAIDRKQRVARGAGRIAPRAARLVGSRIRRLCRAPLSRLLAQGRSRPQDRSTPSCCASTEAAMRSLATEFATDAFRGVTELTVVAPDHPRLLVDHRRRLRGGRRQYRRCADLHDDRRPGARHDLASAAPSTATRTSCAAPTASPTPSKSRCAAKSGSARSSPPGAGRRRPARRPSPSPRRSIIDNNLSHRYTVVEVSGLDRPGLLFDLTTVLSRLNLNIGSAHIVTFGEKAVDVLLRHRPHRRQSDRSQPPGDDQAAAPRRIFRRRGKFAEIRITARQGRTRASLIFACRQPDIPADWIAGLECHDRFR